jgi:uncharacterized protein
MARARKGLGHGVGLRPEHFPAISAGEARGRVDFFEIISENFFAPGGRPMAVLEQVRRDFPIVMHGVSLSIGGSDRLNGSYLRELRGLAERIQPEWVSDHLCWGTFAGRYAHDLLPMPLTEEALADVVRRVEKVQAVLGRQLVLENASSYLEFDGATLTEWQFFAELSRRTGCGMLLDVNNVYVAAYNHGFSAGDYLAGIPVESVVQFHLAGHENRGAILFDGHDRAVIDPVWSLYREAVRRFGPVPTLVEWDANIPSWDRLAKESERAARHMREALSKRDPKRPARGAPRAA